MGFVTDFLPRCVLKANGKFSVKSNFESNPVLNFRKS